MVSVEFDGGAVGSNCNWWADGEAGMACGMVVSPSGTLVGVFDVGAGLSIGCHSAQQSGQRALGCHRYPAAGVVQ